MGMLVNGSWTDDDGKSRGTGGKFDHLPTKFHRFISADGSSGFKAEANRYHVYAFPACPWAHRVTIFRRLKKLEDVVGLTFLKGPRQPAGYSVAEGQEHIIPGTDKKIRYLHEVYSLANPEYTGRVTVPVLWDKSCCTIVNNESSEIIRMLNSEFGAFSQDTSDYYPSALRSEIDKVNDLVYHNINNGVYKAGFSSNQQSYEEAFVNLFKAYDELEKRLEHQRYLCGDQITEADWRLFPTLLRFDTIYYPLFKCNKTHVYEYPNLWNYCRDLYQQPGIAEVCHLTFAKIGYYNNPTVNPNGVVPLGPDIDFDQAHNRNRFKNAA